MLDLLEGQLGYLLKRGGIAGLVEVVGELLWWRGCYRWLLEGAGNARGGAAVVGCWIGKQEIPADFSLVAEEDSKDLRKDGDQEIVERITKLVNDSITSDGSYNVTLSTEDVLKAIDSGRSEAGSQGRHWVLDPIDGTKGRTSMNQATPVAKELLLFLELPDSSTRNVRGLSVQRQRGYRNSTMQRTIMEEKLFSVCWLVQIPLTSISAADQHSPNNEVGCLFFAEVGGGTLLNGSSSVKAQVQVTAVENPEEASFFESYEAAHSMHDLSSLIAQKLGVKAPPVRIDSQAKYGALSREDGAIYLRFPHKGSGWRVTDAAGKPLDFSRGKYLDLDTDHCDQSEVDAIAI
ncbi:SAL1 phosphatase [Hibiscus syriacus]|uniref:SAL1 phosphatase n=1 Tax=Hibiscus syriacus TaxID=106335 RepID=A0A6A3D9G3_HIBSY|nr:SAL1 phosphatase [Hibiscus syriacus]